MNRTHRSVLRVALVCLLLFSAARSLPATEGWLPVPPEDLALKDNPKQPGADAMILYRELIDDASKASASGDTVEEYVRIKVFTEEGTKYGHVEIPFSKSYQNIVYVAGRTIKPDGSVVKFDGQVLETTVEKSSGLKILVKSFTLPDVQPGCIMEYKYQMQGQPGWVHSQEWIVSQPIYTREAHFVYTPDTGYGNDLKPMNRTYWLPRDATLKELVNGSYQMVVHDISGVVEEPLMPPEKTIEARVEFFYQDDSAPLATDPSEHYWNHYGKKLDGELEHFIDKKNVLNEELSKIVSSGDADEVKLRKIYARVQQVRNLNLENEKMKKENKDENLKPNSNVEDVLKHGYAYGTEINYLFVGLARAAGFDATEVYVAPRSVDLFLPSQNNFRQILDEFTWVRAGSKEYYLDPSAGSFPFGLLPWYETETGGIRVDKHGATIVTTPEPLSSDSNLVRTADLEVKDDGSISGTLHLDFQGQRAALLREEKRQEDDAGRTKDLEGDIRRWLPVGSTFEITQLADWDHNDRPIHVEGTLTIPSFGTGAAQRMLLPLEIFEATETASFASEKRYNAVYFHYPYEETDDLKLHMPPGYKAETMPPDRKVNLGAVSYDLSTTAAPDGTVEVKRHLMVNGILFSKDQYPTLRRFFAVVKTNDHAQMVFQNAASAKND
jgi:Domain of Unknown Function with PDB structure (DUF3857)